MLVSEIKIDIEEFSWLLFGHYKHSFLSFLKQIRKQMSSQADR